MKPFLIGQHIAFDEGFLCQMFEYAGLMNELKRCFVVMKILWKLASALCGHDSTRTTCLVPFT